MQWRRVIERHDTLSLPPVVRARDGGQTMKPLDIVLNAIIVLSVTVFLAYVGFLHFDFGLFMTLPSHVTGFFLDRPVLQHVSLGVLVAALVAKVPVGRAISRREAARST
jgi:hypothetical protein